jgi:hypothetical protein
VRVIPAALAGDRRGSATVLTDEVAEEGPAPDAEAKALAARIAALTPEQREALKALLG